MKIIIVMVCLLQGCIHADCVKPGLIAGERVFLTDPPNQVALIKATRGHTSRCLDPRYPIQADLIR
jgi:hypothetical protein